jgi:hypothetical protein
MKLQSPADILGSVGVPDLQSTMQTTSTALSMPCGIQVGCLSGAAPGSLEMPTLSTPSLGAPAPGTGVLKAQAMDLKAPTLTAPNLGGKM